MVAGLTFLCMPFAIPLAHRVRRQTLRLTIVGLTLLSGVVIANGTIFYSSVFLLTQLAPARGFRVLIGSLVGVVGGLIGAVISVNVVALLMSKGLNKSLTWFRYEWAALVLYGVPALIGKMGSSR